MERYAKQTFLALLNPYETVVHTYPGIIDKVRPSMEKHGYAACKPAYRAFHDRLQ